MIYPSWSIKRKRFYKKSAKHKLFQEKVKPLEEDLIVSGI